MATQFGIYKCGVCGNIVEVLHEGVGTLVCCGKDMIFMKENTVKQEGKGHREGVLPLGAKHVPIIINDRKVKVGSVPHPMEKEHYIEWIEGMDGLGHSAKYFLEPGDKPEVTFGFDVEHARAYCNVHGLWIS